MNESIFRQRLRSSIKRAIAAAEDVKRIQHQGLKGRLREVALNELIRPLLPTGVEANTGVVVDSRGTQSSQMDIIIYSTTLLPAFMKVEEQVIVPVEACIQTIEVKSRLTAREVGDTVEKAQSIKNLYLQLNEQTKIRVAPIFSLFAFATDLTGTNEDEWQRYEHIKPQELRGRVLLNDICVVGKGYWSLGGGCAPPSVEFDEVFAMLAMTANSIPHWISCRGTPQFGHYLGKAIP